MRSVGHPSGEICSRAKGDLRDCFPAFLTPPSLILSAALIGKLFIFLVVGGLVFGTANAAPYVSNETPALPGLLRPFIFIALIILPGAWIGFSPLARRLDVWMRLCLSVVLSPLVLFAQFYMLRLFGLPVGLLPFILTLINASAGFLIFKARREFVLPDRVTFVATLAVLALPLSFLAYSFHDETVLVLRAHNWLHSDLVYQFLAGKLLPEEMALAGEVTAYPWAAHIYQSILSATLHVAPSLSYALTNIVWLLALFGIAALIAKEFGGGRIAQITAPIWVTFAVNPVGLGIRQVAPLFNIRDIVPWDLILPIFGDPRYTSVLRKYYNFNQMPFAFALLGALTYLAIVERPDFGPKARGALMGAVLISMLVIYPLFLPVGCGIIGARIVAVWFNQDAKARSSRRSEAVALFIAMAVTCTLAFPYLEIILQDRIGGSGPRLDFSMYQIKKVAHTGFALILPVAAFAFVARRLWPGMQTALLVIGLTAVGLIALHIFVHIPNWRGEYKFIMAAAVILTPFVGVAIEPWVAALQKNGRITAVFAVAAASLAIATPSSIRLFTEFGYGPVERPDVFIDGLDLRYAASEPLAGALDTIRTRTPPSTLIVFAQKKYYLPTIARRTAFTPYDQFEALAGVGFPINYMLFSVKGYDTQKSAYRVASVTNLYFGDNDDVRAEALGEMLALARPVAIIINRSTEQDLEAWLGTTNGAAAIHEDDSHAVWLVYPNEFDHSSP